MVHISSYDLLAGTSNVISVQGQHPGAAPEPPSIGSRKSSHWPVYGGSQLHKRNQAQGISPNTPVSCSTLGAKAFGGHCAQAWLSRCPSLSLRLATLPHGAVIGTPRLPQRRLHRHLQVQPYFLNPTLPSALRVAQQKPSLDDGFLKPAAGSQRA
jgi:hypothetical protein